jgi:hypothetical protein
MSRGFPDVHVVTIREVGEAVVVARGHGVHQIGNEQFPARRFVQGTHPFDAGESLDPRYGHVVHTASTGYRR